MGPAAAGPQHQQQQQQEEQLLSSCLGLLDVKQAEGGKHVDINADMFRKPNAKAFELILYHAYCTIKGKAAAKKVCATTPPCLWMCLQQQQPLPQPIPQVNPICSCGCAPNTNAPRCVPAQNLRGLWPLLDKDRKQSKEFYQVGGPGSTHTQQQQL